MCAPLLQPSQSNIGGSSAAEPQMVHTTSASIGAAAGSAGSAGTAFDSSDGARAALLCDGGADNERDR
eukprot:9884868-Alexandrium_andersonii.AAC.1